GYLPVYRLAAYEWLRFLQSAALGDYDLATEELEELTRSLSINYRTALGQMRRLIPLTVCTELGLAAAPTQLFVRVVMQDQRRQFPLYLNEVLFLALQRADLSVLGGLLATERGLSVEALSFFDEAFKEVTEQGTPSVFATAPLAAAYRHKLNYYRVSADRA